MIVSPLDKVKLEAAGFGVVPGDGFVDVTAPQSTQPTRIPVNVDGTLTLITQRSALHREIATALAAQGFYAP